VPPRFTGRNTNPSVTPADEVQASCATFTHVGIGIVRTRPFLPTRSTMHHRPSRCWTWLTVSAATSDRRRPQPRSRARIARSRSPLVVLTSGAFSSFCACRLESQFPRRRDADRDRQRPDHTQWIRPRCSKFFVRGASDTVLGIIGNLPRIRSERAPLITSPSRVSRKDGRRIVLWKPGQVRSLINQPPPDHHPASCHHRDARALLPLPVGRISLPRQAGVPKRQGYALLRYGHGVS
jgi:hypothetical protein